MADILEKSKSDIVKAPEGFEGHGFFATKLDEAVGLAQKIHCGHCHSLHHAVVLSLWLQWHLIMT